ncbi:MAG TPA: hypothetical protein VFB01_18475 [Burkholderiales bacterium]|nr:hypothetical protein [Burkholderiales bacterium]
MYWWNLRAAKRELGAGAPGARRLLPYVIAFAAVEGLIVEFSFLLPAQQNLTSARVWLAAGISIAITVAGCLYVYRRNGGAAGTTLLERLLVLGWVAGVRYTVFVLLALAVFFGIAVALYPEVGDAAGEWSDEAFMLASAGFYLYLGRHVGDHAAAKEG